MKYTSALISDARNKLGGDIFARNRAGLYVRVKVKPKNPKTTNQQANRANFSTFTKGWRSLTAAQIAGWNNLANSSTLTDTLGNSFMPSGLQLYVGLNRNLAQIGATAISDAPGAKPSFPTILGRPGFSVVIPGYRLQVVVYLTAGAYAALTNLQASFTKGLSAGVTFVGGSLYRSVGTPTGPYSVGAYWLVFTGGKVPLPAVGAQIGIRLRLVDPSTGYASAAETTRQTVAYG
jgi:hypothetical protein